MIEWTKPTSIDGDRSEPKVADTELMITAIEQARRCSGPLSVPDARPLVALAHITGYRNSSGQFNAKSSEILAKPSVLFSELFDL